MKALFLVFMCNTIASSLKIKAVLKRCSDNSVSDEHENKGEECQHKIDITLRLVTSAKDSDASHYIKVDTVYDEESEEDIKLFHPLIVKVENKPATTVYPLTFLQTVNNKPYEVFLHKDNLDHYSGCQESTLWSLCGFEEDSKTSKGFCCSCKDHKEQYHIRGGQDCTNEETSPKQEKEGYTASAHCLKFDPVWYSVNALQAPQAHHEVSVHVFCEAEGDGKTTTWMSLLDGEDVVLGMTNTHKNSKNGKILVDYSGLLVNESDPLDYKNNRLLIPEPNPELDSHKLPLQLMGNSSEFLLINTKHFQLDGGVCDKIGVSYEAFVNQHNRCNMPAQSCLDNQPMHFWLRDMEKRILKRPSTYFLGGFVEGEPFLSQKDMTWYLHLRQKEPHVARIQIQMKADMLLPLHRGNHAEIVQVTYADLGNTEVLNVELYNPSLLVEEYSIRIHKCNITQYGQQEKAAQIQPHHSVVFSFAVDTGFSSATKRCVVSVQNTRNKQTVDRHIDFKQGQVCMCLQGCLCTCGEDRYKCVSVNNTLGVTLPHMQESIFTSAHDVRFILAATCLLLFIVGAMKASISVVSPVSVGQFGLCLFTSNVMLPHYIEKDLREMPVIFDKDGVPVNPRTGKSVQLLPMYQLIILNLFIGFYLPFIGLHWLLMKMCKKDIYHKTMKEKNCWKQKLTASQLDIPDIDSKFLTNCLQTSPRSMNKISQDLTISHYRRSKRDMKYKEGNYVSMTSHEVATPQSGVSTELENTEDSEQMVKGREKIRNRKSRKAMSTKPTLQTLLQTSPVYYNFNQQTPFLRNSGDTYSLCGNLVRVGRRYRFELDKYTMQTYENRDGTRKLARAQKISHVDQFTQILTSADVHKLISTEPLFPCLNQPVLR